MKVTALIPAHNEEDTIIEAILSLLAQSRLPDRIIVVADNCTDETVSRTALFKDTVEVVETVGNRHKKAGALNQALSVLLPTLTDEDAILVMDADSTLAEGFVSTGIERLKEKDVGACGGIFYAARTTNLVECLQAAEYARYAREIARGKAKAKVITGTGSLFLAKALKEVKKARKEGSLPGDAGAPNVYDTKALTEDNELTLALKHLGYRCVSPKSCVVRTEVMPTWRRLWRQRMRWQRGAIENLRSYGLTGVTAPYIARQAFTGIGVVATALLMMITIATLALGIFAFNPFWTGLTGLFLAERVITVRRLGPVAVVLASVLVVEMFYEMFQQMVYVRAAWDSLLRRKEMWGTHTFGKGVAGGLR